MIARSPTFSEAALAQSLLVWTAAAWLAGCSGSEPGGPGGSIAFTDQRPELSAEPAIAAYLGTNPVVLEALEQLPTGLDLHRNVILRTCGPSSGVCHNQKQYPDLHTPANFRAAIGAPCNVQPGEWSSVYDGCEQPGDALALGEGPSAEIAYLDFIAGTARDYDEQDPPQLDSPGLHIVLDPPLGQARAESRSWSAVRIFRNIVSEQARVEELTFASYQTEWWLLGQGRHLFGRVAEWQVDGVEQLLASGIVAGDMNRNGVFGARRGQPMSILTPGFPERSYLIGRLRGEIGGASIPGTRMPLANQPLSLAEMLALYCFIEGLPAASSGVYDLNAPIDYASCRAAANPEELDLLGQGVTWIGRVRPLLEAHCSGCHGGSAPPAGFDILSDGAYERLLAPSSERSPLPLVTPGDPAQSYLWLKLNGDESIVGSGMPIGPGGTQRKLSPGELGDIETWISNGAKASE